MFIHTQHIIDVKGRRRMHSTAVFERIVGLIYPAR